jgi:NO-binding membrane sensor protein with MHYT domain
MNPASYELFLVGLSFLIAVYGSYTALQFASAIPHADTWGAVIGSVGGAAVALGGAIWAMHFIGMNSVDWGLRVSYDPLLVIASLVAAILGAALGLLVVGRSDGGPLNLPLGALLTGLGVVLMQFIGMAAMIVAANASYDPTFSGVSILIAVLASGGILWLAFNLGIKVLRFGAAVLIGLALCAMHYTAMYALKLSPTKAAVADAGLSISPATAAYSAFGVAAVILTLLLAYSGWKSARTLTSNL